VVKYKYDTLDNLPDEVLTDIRALTDQFLIALPNNNNRLGHKSPTVPLGSILNRVDLGEVLISMYLCACG